MGSYDGETRTEGDEDVSSDAMDHIHRGKPKLSKKEKRAFAIQKSREEEILATGAPPPDWMTDRSLLPKAPPKKIGAVR